MRASEIIDLSFFVFSFCFAYSKACMRRTLCVRASEIIDLSFFLSPS